MSDDRLTDELLVLVGFLFTSARGLVDEPKAYGPTRLLDAASRLLAVMDEHDMLGDSLRAVKTEIDYQLSGPWDEEELLGGLDELALRWTQLIAQRL